MKSKYVKPMVVAETLSLAMPLASNCTVNRDDMEGLLWAGYFNSDPEFSCRIIVDEESDLDMHNQIGDSKDPICYYSNVAIALVS